MDAAHVTGRDVCDALLTGPGQRRLVKEALAEVADGRVWTAILPVSTIDGTCQITVHCEPLADTGVLVIARKVTPHDEHGPAAAAAAPAGPLVSDAAVSDAAVSGPGSGRPGSSSVSGGQREPDGLALTDATTRIGTTLDLYRTAREAADVAVPAFADATAIFVSERLLAADELGPSTAGPRVVVRRLVSRLAGYSAPVTDSIFRPGEALVFGLTSPSYRAMRGRSTVRFDQLDDESAERIASRPGGQEAFAAYTNFLAVPLVARGIVLGCATFARSGAWREFTQADVALAEELASRAAISIDNARLYDRERRTASALQQGLLPNAPSVPAGMAIAHRYVPVGASIVGGDWHDIVPLLSGRAALIVGDAMGHGPEAAAVMVQLRTAAHTLADLELPPEEILGRLDRMATAMQSTPFATCIAAVIDPADGSCVIAKAGHLPPMLTLPDGTTRVIDLPLGLPIGLGTGSFESERIPFPPGATLALYTDGLVESRSRSLDDGLAALSSALTTALTRPGHTLDGSCEQVTSALHARGEDDITLVLARVLETAAG